MSAAAPNPLEPAAGPTLAAAPRAASRLEAAFGELLAALQEAGTDASATDLWRTPQRAAALWRDQLLAGSRTDVGALLARPMRHRGQAPVVLRNVGVHLVCPHHLTVAWGKAHLAYVPTGFIAGSGRLCDLVQALTARFVLQEEAAQNICDALVQHLQASAAVALIEAIHPCHTVSRPQSHDARLLCWGQSGKARPIASLQRLLLPTAPRVKRRSR